MHKFADKLTNQTTSREISIPISRLNDLQKNNFLVVEDLFVGINADGFVVYDRVCDHNGGFLTLDPDQKSATCPIHKWTLNLTSGVYENGCPKKALPTWQKRDELIVVKYKSDFPEIQTIGLTNSDISFKFNAHASVSVGIDGVNFITDPWFIGSCFANGWWHAFPPSQEAIERLSNADYIYISHNHPDHLHIPTLERYVKKSTPILVPNFESKSVVRMLRRIGFDNLIVCDFMQEVLIQTKNGGVKLVIIKSGDDRDDSCLLICTEKRRVFFAVDTNMPNRWILPKVDVLFTPFAGGASGFPVRIENFDVARKSDILAANRSAILNTHVSKLIESTRPDFVIPYAGYFTEIQRDFDVKNLNVKNSSTDLISFVESKYPKVKGIDPINNPFFSLGEKGLQLENVFETPSYLVDQDYITSIISEGLKGKGVLTADELVLAGQRFISSEFFDNLTVVIIPSNDLITEDLGVALIVDFSIKNRSTKIMQLNGETDLKIISIIDRNLNNVELLRVRAESLAMVLRDGMPFEDLSIGFQIKMYRDPNIYNFKFWDHFTNKEFIRL